jgi:hypothetical protein
MRIRFSEDEDYQNAAILWEANQERSLKSRKGQAALRRLEAALLALPEPKLIADAIEADGMVCGLGALAKFEHYEGSLMLPEASWSDWGSGPEIEDAMLALAQALDVPKLVAVAIIAENDNEWAVKTPEQRYNHLLRWTRRWLLADCSTWTTKNMEGYIE